MAGFGAPPPAALMITFPRRGVPAFPDPSLRRLFWPYASRDDLCAGNPLSHPPPHWQAPAADVEHREPLSRAALLTQRASETRDAFRRCVPRIARDAHRAGHHPRAATGTSGRPSAQLPTRVHAQPLCARSARLPRLFAGAHGPRAAHRLLQPGGSTSTPTPVQAPPKKASNRSPARGG